MAEIKDDVCQVPGCKNEVTVDDYGYVLCAVDAKRMPWRELLRRAEEKDRFMFEQGL